MIEATQDASAAPARRRARARGTRARPIPPASNVVPLHQRLLPRHAEILARWLEAGRAMGLCDGSLFPAERRGRAGLVRAQPEYVLIWVRENIDPAYMIRPDGIGWVLIDSVRENELARTRSFTDALQLIRPVL